MEVKEGNFQENMRSPSSCNCLHLRVLSIQNNINNNNNMRYFVQVVVVVLLLITTVSGSSVPCTTTDECEQKVRQGSECLESGFCSNPFYKGGCLANMLHQRQQQQQDDDGNNGNSTNPNNNTTKRTSSTAPIRVCSSEDPPDAEQLGYCISNVNLWNYTEIRLMGNNWESIFFETWIVQIILSEILGVPTSVDTGFADKHVDFYDQQGRIEYGKGYDWDAIRVASDIRDCRMVQQSENVDDGIYKSCAHVSLEVWEGQEENLNLLQEENFIENPTALGVLGDGGWFVPRFTAKNDSTLLSHFGLSGEENRRKLAKTFLRPTKWIDYCTEVSMTNCTEPDDVALRPPGDPEEDIKMFMEGSYTGYFRKTSENDCDANPLTCTGHIVDYPCGWSSFLQQQTYQLNIALQSSGDEPVCGGYTYGQMVDIWHAANATKSHVLMLYWSPDSLEQKFSGTESEFQKVQLPKPTQVCFDNRVSTLDRCGPDLLKRIGTSPLGACDAQPQTLMKVISTKLYEICNDPKIPLAIRSPAYDVIKNFYITSLQLGTVFESWLQPPEIVTTATNNDTNKNDHSNRIADPREAVCQWVVDNYDIIESFIPRTYPRVLEDDNGGHTGKKSLYYVSLVIGILALVLILVVSCAVYKLRNRRVMEIAEVEFLFILLSGLILVQLGSFALALPPSNASCVLAVWAINLGYTLELIPLIIKVAAINKLMIAARRMKRISINGTNLYIAVAVFTLLMIVYLIIWTTLDPPNKITEYILTDTTNENGDTIVKVHSFCRSDENMWELLTLIWRCILLLWATVLAVQTRKSPINFNETKILAILIYSHFLFLVWMLVLFFLGSKMDTSNIARYASLILSIDVATACCIYFLPKILTTDEDFQKTQGQQKPTKTKSVESMISSGGNTQRNKMNNSNMIMDDSQSQDLGRSSKNLGEGSELNNNNSTNQITNNENDIGNIINRIFLSGTCAVEPAKSDKCPTSNVKHQFSSIKDAMNVSMAESPMLSDFKVYDDHVHCIVQYKNQEGNYGEISVKGYQDGKENHNDMVCKQLDSLIPLPHQAACVQTTEISHIDDNISLSEQPDSNTGTGLHDSEENDQAFDPEAILKRLVGKTMLKL